MFLSTTHAQELRAELSMRAVGFPPAAEMRITSSSSTLSSTKQPPEVVFSRTLPPAQTCCLGLQGLVRRRCHDLPSSQGRRIETPTSAHARQLHISHKCSSNSSDWAPNSPRPPNNCSSMWSGPLWKPTALLISGHTRSVAYR